MRKRVAAACIVGICCALISACGRAEIKLEDTGTIEETENTDAMEEIAVEEKADYWLCGTGIPDGPDYTGGVCEVYFKPNSIVLEGSFLKSTSREDQEEQIGTVEAFTGEELEVSTNCEIVRDEGNDAKSYLYGKYIETMEVPETDNVAGIYIAITVEDGRVTEIYHSS